METIVWGAGLKISASGRKGLAERIGSIRTAAMIAVSQRGRSSVKRRRKNS
jgi:hypothetical protein